MQNSSALRSWCSLWYSDIQSSDNKDIFLACCTYFPSGEFLVVYRYGPQEKSHYKKEINGWPFSIGLHIIGDGAGCWTSVSIKFDFCTILKMVWKIFLGMCIFFLSPPYSMKSRGTKMQYTPTPKPPLIRESWPPIQSCKLVHWGQYLLRILKRAYYLGGARICPTAMVLMTSPKCYHFDDVIRIHQIMNSS